MVLTSIKEVSRNERTIVAIGYCPLIMHSFVVVKKAHFYTMIKKDF